MENWKERTKELFIGLGSAIGWDAIKDLLKNEAKNGATVAAKAAFSRATSDNRSKAMVVIAKMATSNTTNIQSAGKILDENQRNRQACTARPYGAGAPYVKGDEDRLIALCIGKLCDAFPKNFLAETGPVIVTLTWMAESHERLDARLEGFINDFAGQKIGWAADKLKKMCVDAIEKAGKIVVDPQLSKLQVNSLEARNAASRQRADLKLAQGGYIR